MTAPWIASSSHLPETDQRIEFLLIGRDVSMQGIYSIAGFRSHWSTYEAGRVAGWRSLPGPAVSSWAGNAGVNPISSALQGVDASVIA